MGWLERERAKCISEEERGIHIMKSSTEISAGKKLFLCMPDSLPLSS